MPSDRGYLFITGATGLIGHYLVAELLRRGDRCAVLLRPPVDRSLDRLSALLWELGCDARGMIENGLLLPLEGDLCGPLPKGRDLNLKGVVHGAAATNFRTDPRGEPERTNVTGTARLLDWANEAGVTNFHLISSAYVCGRTDRPVAESLDTSPPEFHNDYEGSKWQAERLCAAWAETPGRQLTVYRPSVVVGEHVTGRSSKFAGVYLSARATELLHRMFRDADHATRHAIPLRLKGRADGHQNIVPVDYIARMIAAIVHHPDDHGRIYHLTHPNPPTNQTIKQAYEQHFDIESG